MMTLSLLLLANLLLCCNVCNGASQQLETTDEDDQMGMILAELKSLRMEVDEERTTTKRTTETLEQQQKNTEKELKSLRMELDEEKTSTWQQLKNTEEELKAVRMELDEEKTSTKTLEQKLKRTDTEWEQEKATIQTLKEELDAAVDLMHDDGSTEQIAFTVVSHQDFGPVTVDTPIPFEVVETNIGGGWNPGINVFQTTVAGTYVFATSIVGASNQAPYVALVHTDAQTGSRYVASMVSTSTGRTGDANVAILQLSVGDYVSVQLLPTNNAKLYSTPDLIYNTFSGFYLFA